MEGRVRWKVYYSCCFGPEYPNLNANNKEMYYCHKECVKEGHTLSSGCMMRFEGFIILSLHLDREPQVN